MSHTFWKLVNVIIASSLTGSPDLFPSSKNQSCEVHHYRQVLVIFAEERLHGLLHEVLAFLVSRWVISKIKLFEIFLNLETITLSIHFLLAVLDKNLESFEMKNVSFLIRLLILKTTAKFTSHTSRFEGRINDFLD